MRILFSGGGTGGHIYPAIAVAEEIMKRNPGCRISFTGARGKMEMEKVPKAGFEIKGLWISGFQRQLTWKNVLIPAKILVSLVQARSVIARFVPDVVIGFGGYASGATVLMASWMGIPTAIQEQNSYPGMTNRLLAGRVDKVFLGYDSARQYIKRAENVIWTGNPVRSGLLEPVDATVSRNHFGLDPAKKTVLVMGGSLGAKSLNEALKWSFDEWKDEQNIQLLWQCGKLYYEDYKVCNMANLPFVRILPFIDDMKKAYGAADVVVSRAGALTVSELAVSGKPAVLVPSPNVAEDHQTKNAQTLKDSDAAILLPDNEVGKRLYQTLKTLLKDGEQMKRLTKNIKLFAKPDAVLQIADELIELIKKPGD